VLLTWVDYDAGVADFVRDVLPRLEAAGLRKPATAPAATAARVEVPA
jgi:hypothetical protein